MIKLKPQTYEKAIPFFINIAGCDVTINSIKLGEEGSVYVDFDDNPQVAYVQTFYGFHYLGGNFNQSFFNEVINHITLNVLPEQTLHPYIFMFYNDNEWKAAISKKFAGVKGEFIERLYYNLNKDRFENNINKYQAIPSGYRIIVDNADELKVSALYNDEEIGACRKGSKGVYADIDYFVDENHRHKGIALCLGTVFIKHCLEKGYILRGGSWSKNIPSVQLAKKLGFDVVSTIEAFWCELL